MKERVKTGIKGLDDILSGGIPRGNLVMLTGEPGTGKTIMCLQFLAAGAKENEPGVYVSLEEPEKHIIKVANDFGWDLEELTRKDLLKIEFIELYDFEKMREQIEDAIDSIKAKRVAIDPGVMFRLYFERELDARKSILSLGRMLKDSGVTTLITNERGGNNKGLYGLEEYVSDGVIVIYHSRIKGRFVRGVGIIKMRGTKVSEKIHPLSINLKGVEIDSAKQLTEEL